MRHPRVCHLFVHLNIEYPQWLDRMELLLKTKRQASPPPLAKLSGADAAKEILSLPFLDISEVGFDEVEAKRLGVRLGSRVAVRPDGIGASRSNTDEAVLAEAPRICSQGRGHSGQSRRAHEGGDCA